MRIMTRMGKGALDVLGEDGEFVPCLHSVGYPLADGREDVPWPCDETNKYIVHFPESREIWSYGSGYGGNALLGKKCFALRIASVMARDEGWMAEHMLILKLTSPEGETKYVTGAFPSACGKTNLAMLIPTLPGWKVETIGDDIAWMKFGPDGRLHAINPEAGFFGVAPGTGREDEPERDGDDPQVLDLHELRADRRRRRVVGGHDQGAAARTRSTGTATTGRPTPTTRPRIRTRASRRPRRQCPSIADEWEDPAGVPIDAILFGGRRATVVPLVREAFDWEHGVFMGSIMSSETTAAAAGRRRQAALRPVRDAAVLRLPHGRLLRALAADRRARATPSKLPRLFHVNWFRKDDDGKFLWPGFGENSRVLAWIFRRCEGTADAVETPVGLRARRRTASTPPAST